MVNPIQITQPQAYSGGADFTPLSKLYDVYKESQQRAMQEAALGRLGDDPIANRQALTASGVLPLAKLGIGMQDTEIARRREDITAEQAQANWVEQQKLRQSADVRAGSEEARAQAKQAEALKYATREQRLAAVKNPEAGLDINEPEIRRWVALGGDIPDMAKNRLGLGAPVYMRDAEGNLKAYQLSATGTPVEIKVQGQTVLGPGDMAAQKEQGKVTGKATGAAIVALPKLVDSATHQAQLLDEISAHPGRQWATGALSAVPDWALKGTPGAGFRQRFGQIKAQSFLSIYDQMRGAGQITNTEGDKGTSAVNRMDTASTEKEFDDAVKDLKEILKIGIERSQRAAKGDFSLHPKELQDLQQKLGVGAPGAPTAPAAARPDPLGLR